MHAPVPVVEVADDADAGRVRRPDREVDAFDAADRHRMGAELVVDAGVVAFAEEIEVVVGEHPAEAVGVVDLGGVPAGIVDPQPVLGHGADARHHHLVDAGRVLARHGERRLVAEHEADALRRRNDRRGPSADRLRGADRAPRTDPRGAPRRERFVGGDHSAISSDAPVSARPPIRSHGVATVAQWSIGAAAGDVSAERTDTCCQPVNAAPSAASAKSQPAPSSSRGTPSRMPGSQTPSAADNAQVAGRHDRDEPQLTEDAVRRLPAQLGAQRRFRPRPLRVDLRPLHLHADAVAIERLLQGGDDDAGEPGLDLAEAATAQRWRARQPFGRPLTEAPRHLDEPAHGVDDPGPLRESHGAQLKEGVTSAQARPVPPAISQRYVTRSFGCGRLQPS